MAQQGYYRYPNILGDRIVFVSEDDLWQVSSEGGHASRLTACVSDVSSPAFSPDGKWIAFVGCDEGPYEVYVMPSSGGEARRLTYQASFCRVLGWSIDGNEIMYSSNAHQMVDDFKVIFAIPPTGGLPRQIPLGTGTAISYGPRGGVVLGRNTGEYSRRKGYRGGRVGHLWCDSTGNGTFERLLHLNGNITNPCWVGERIYFLSDHDGIGNLYSCIPTGEGVCQHSNHRDFYARHLSSDGQRLVYDAGADLYLFDPAVNQPFHLAITQPSSHTQRNRKFVSAADYLDTYALHPQGHSLALTTRGKAFSLGNWEGPVLQYGQRNGVRYRFLEWLNDGKRMIAVSDAPGRETLVLFNHEEKQEKMFSTIEIGRVTELLVSPSNDVIALTNHRHELMVVDLKAETKRILDCCPVWYIGGMAWSSDGRWLAYPFALSLQQSAIKLCDVENGEAYQITEPVLHDSAPAFDPDGKYLYFLGQRAFNPVYDNLQFDLNFPSGVKPYLIPLQKNLVSPFLPQPRAFDAKETDEKEKQAGSEVTPTIIDLEGISRRIVPFPVKEGRFQGVHAVKGKVLLLSFPVETLLDNPPVPDEANGIIEAYDLKALTFQTLIDNVTSFTLSRDRTTLAYRTNDRLRVLKAGDKASELEEGEKASRETGWISLQRVRVSVEPVAEWRQMVAEAWRLQQEQFWRGDQAKHLDWERLATRYAPLLERINSRSELSDLLWELQGELATSHAYEYDGDYRESPSYCQGFLGVDWQYDAMSQRYRILHILKGDPSHPETTSPLAGPGLLVSEGDAVLAINGQTVTEEENPQALLVDQGGQEVQLAIESIETKEVRLISVKALTKEQPLRYRTWVETTRQSVHRCSRGRVGYIHLPDMSARGYAEFHRSYRMEFDAEALVIDVRWNDGGNISSLLLSKLARKRIGYTLSRWGTPRPYPSDSPRGPMVALTNEHAGSDGDLFCHSFKVLGLGPLIGKRTWGGTIGIRPQHDLVDGTTTTQPECASWFHDIGFGLENRGVDPHVEVEIMPQDYSNGIDPQLERAIVEALRQIDMKPPLTRIPAHERA